MRVALDEICIGGVDTIVALHQKLMLEQDFRDGGFDIHHLERLIEGDVLNGAKA
jgi:acetyl-CoA carboxylase biotin carboxylase subunit